MTIPDRKLASGTRLIVKYKQQEHTAEVIAGEDGHPRYRLADGREFRSPSSAGKAVMGGKACNGWRFWSVAGEAPSAAARTKQGASRPTTPSAPHSDSPRPTAPKGRKAATTARTARKAAQRSAPAKAKGRKTTRKAPKRTAKAKKR